MSEGTIEQKGLESIMLKEEEERLQCKISTKIDKCVMNIM